MFNFDLFVEIAHLPSEAKPRDLLLVGSTSKKKKKSKGSTRIEPPLFYSEETNMDYTEAIGKTKGQHHSRNQKQSIEYINSNATDSNGSSSLPSLTRPRANANAPMFVIDSSRSNSPASKSGSSSNNNKPTKEASTKDPTTETNVNSNKQMDENNNLIDTSKTLSKKTLASTSSDNKKKRKLLELDNLDLESASSVTSSLEFSSNSSDVPPKSKLAKLDVNRSGKRRVDGAASVLGSDSSTSSCSMPGSKTNAKASSIPVAIANGANLKSENSKVRFFTSNF